MSKNPFFTLSQEDLLAIIQRLVNKYDCEDQEVYEIVKEVFSEKQEKIKNFLDVYEEDKIAFFDE